MFPLQCIYVYIFPFALHCIYAVQMTYIHNGDIYVGYVYGTCLRSE